MRRVGSGSVGLGWVTKFEYTCYLNVIDRQGNTVIYEAFALMCWLTASLLT